MDEELQNLADQSTQILDSVIPNVWAEAAIIIMVGLGIAKLTELFICRVAPRLMARTKNKLDDRVVQLLHRPLFNTFAVLGLLVATDTIADQLGDTILRSTIAFLKTLVI